MGRFIDWPDMFSIADEELSGSRRTLLTLAASLYTDAVTVSLNDVVRQLDEADFETAVHAMKILRGVTSW